MESGGPQYIRVLSLNVADRMHCVNPVPTKILKKGTGEPHYIRGSPTNHLLPRGGLKRGEGSLLPFLQEQQRQLLAPALAAHCAIVCDQARRARASNLGSLSEFCHSEHSEESSISDSDLAGPYSMVLRTASTLRSRINGSG